MAAPRPEPRLDPKRIGIASPCSERWEDMRGDERVRHCARCRLDVYNVERMSLAELEDELRRTDGKLCVRLYRREDGTVLTRDCPVGLRMVRIRMAAALVTAVAVAWAVLLELRPTPSSSGESENGSFTARVARFKDEARDWPLIGPVVNKLHPLPPAPTPAPEPAHAARAPRQRHSLGGYAENSAD